MASYDFTRAMRHVLERSLALTQWSGGSSTAASMANMSNPKLGQPHEKVHPVADLFPLLGQEELEELAADIRERGLLHPIVLDQEGQVLDGRNRLKSCELAGVEPVFTTYQGEDPAGYALSVNIARQHLSKGQIAMVAAKNLLLSNNGQVAVAKALGLSQARISQASVVLQHGPDLADQVLSGALALNDAYKEAQERKLAALRRVNLLARIRETSPDIAQRVDAEEITLEEAKRRDQERLEEQRDHETEVRIASKILCDLIQYTTLYTHEVGRQQQLELFDPHILRPVTKAEIQQAAANLNALAHDPNLSCARLGVAGQLWERSKCWKTEGE